MSQVQKQVMLDDKEIRTLIEVLKFAEGACPVESINPDFAIDAEKIEKIISKLENL